MILVILVLAEHRLCYLYFVEKTVYDITSVNLRDIDDRTLGTIETAVVDRTLS